jgi:hypothetical protein
MAIALLRGDIDATVLQAVVSSYTPGHSIGDRLAALLPEWNELRRSLLEKRHTLVIQLPRDEVTALPNVGGAFEHRFLSARAELFTTKGPLGVSLVLRKLPPDNFVRENRTLESFSFPIQQQLVLPDSLATSSPFVLEDYHYVPLFGRSVIGGWELSLQRKGNSAPIPPVENIELELRYSFRR